MTLRSIRDHLSRIAAAAAVAASAGAADADTTRDTNEPRAEEVDTEAAGQPLATALAELEPIEATQAACELALSHDRLSRLAIASALEWRFHLVGDDIVIDHLASDPDARVRRAAARAAWARRTTGGDAGGVLARLASDPDPAVRDVVSLAAPER
jgi:hypothetical protein